MHKLIAFCSLLLSNSACKTTLSGTQESEPIAASSAFLPSNPCSDAAQTLYGPPGTLPESKGAIIKCAFDEEVSATDLEARARAVGYEGAAFTSGARIYRILYRTERPTQPQPIPGYSVAMVYIPTTPRAAKLPVIAVGHGSTLLCHEQAWARHEGVLAELGARLGDAFTPVVVPADEVSLDDAVATYLFNSQLLPRADGRLLLVAPAECRENDRVARYLDAQLASGGPIAEVLAFDLRQSMRNGGGPACLRLAIELTPVEREAIDARVFLDDALAFDLDAWVRKHYRDRLAPEDLGDPALVDESRRALDELTRILRLPAIYPFQLA